MTKVEEFIADGLNRGASLEVQRHAAQVLKLAVRVMDTYNPMTHCTVCDMVTPGNGTTVHRASCPVPELKRLIAR